MLTLRLSRAGTKKRPVYHLVAADKRARRDGRFVENLGYFIPGRDVLVLKLEQIDQWIAKGATVSDTARRLIKQAKKQGNSLPAAKPKYEAPEAKPAAPEAKAPEEKPEEKAPEAPAEQAEAPAAEAESAS